MADTDVLYLYGGGFEGFLCACAEAHTRGARQPLVESADRSDGWLMETVTVPPDPDRARRLAGRLALAGGGATMDEVCRCFLAETPGAESALAAFILLTLERGRCVLGMRQDPSVREVRALAQRVGFEAHRLCGLLRFSELGDGTLYARCGPDHNVLLPLAAHFQARLPREQWVIHDVNRGVAVLWDGVELLPATAPYPGDMPLSDAEETFRQLWRQFTRTISVAERTNPALQRKLMPRRYWTHLVERPEG